MNKYYCVRKDIVISEDQYYECCVCESSEFDCDCKTGLLIE